MTLSKFESALVSLGAILGIAISLLTAGAYYMALWARPDAPAFILGVQSIADVLLRFEDISSVYRLYGRLTVFVALAFIVGVTALRARRGKASGRIEGVGFDLVQWGLWATAAGSFVDFWLGAALLQDLTQPVFLLLTIGGALLYGVGSLLLAAAWWRDSAVPRALTVAWALVVPVGLICLLVLVKHIPSAFVLAMSVAWLVTVSVWGTMARPTLVVSPERGGA